MESEISDKQARLILAAHEAVEKLSRTHQALTMLTKLENEEYIATDSIDISAILQQNLCVFQELFEMKGIFLEKKLEANVAVRLNADLAAILINNLLSNAIRHNYQDGKVAVILTSEKLLIQNTGDPPVLPTEQLFQRFKKNNQSAVSIGLGLAIVKQICDLNSFEVSYVYQEGWHTITVDFSSYL
jgi:signal transduction histidine kinase